MRKVYVLDTNILLADPLSVYSFTGNDVVIPTVALQELDNMKTRMDEVGLNARKFSKILDSLREGGKLDKGVDLEGDSTLQIVPPRSVSVSYEIYDGKTPDNMIIDVALRFKDTGRHVILVSKDVLVRVKADSVGLQAEDYYSDRVISSDDDLYKGFTEMQTDKEIIELLYKGEGIDISHFDLPLHENEFVILTPFEGGGSVIARNKKGVLHKCLVQSKDYFWGVRGKNAGQLMALDLLADKDVPVVSLVGLAGSGKTLITLASALHQSVDGDSYKKVLCTRPIVPVGNDIGFLPGEKEEKLRPWMQPIYDNLEFLFNTEDERTLEDVLSGMAGKLQVDALTYVRGRSIPDQFIIVDEAQNLTKHEVKTILTRVGEGSKVVLMGDPSQIDHPYLDQYNNGLTYAVEKLKEYGIAGHVTLTKGERSTVASIISDIL